MPLSRTHARFFVALALSATLVTFFLRHLWSFSLGNGDELFFSTGAGTFNVPEGTLSQWSNFFSWLWWEHTGRTADWLSGMVYFFGDEEGRWIVSALTTLSAATITWCLHHLYTRIGNLPSQSWLIAPIAILALLFSYAAVTLSALGNLTMYSAAVCNYFVPTALICVVIMKVMTTEKISTLYLSAVLGGFVASMHEQAAAILAVLIFLFVLLDTRWPPVHRLMSSTIALAGIIEMFLAPGLHAKLHRAAETLPKDPISLPNKLLTSFYAFGVYFSLLGMLISLVVSAYLVFFIRSHIRRPLALVLLVLLTFFTSLWGIYLAAQFLYLSFASQKITGIACMFMMTTWLATPLLSQNAKTRFASVLMLCAAAGFAIPAAAGLGAVRVYNYPIIFFIAFLIWSIFLALDHTQITRATEERCSLTIRVFALPTALTFMALWVMVSAYIAFHSNYNPGLANLILQEQQCQQKICPAHDPQLPYQSAMSGYGEHEYASTEAVLEWIEK